MSPHMSMVARDVPLPPVGVASVLLCDPTPLKHALARAWVGRRGYITTPNAMSPNPSPNFLREASLSSRKVLCSAWPAPCSPSEKCAEANFQGHDVPKAERYPCPAARCERAPAQVAAALGQDYRGAVAVIVAAAAAAVNDMPARVDVFLVQSNLVKVPAARQGRSVERPCHIYTQNMQPRFLPCCVPAISRPRDINDICTCSALHVHLMHPLH